MSLKFGASSLLRGLPVAVLLFLEEQGLSIRDNNTVHQDNKSAILWEKKIKNWVFGSLSWNTVSQAIWNPVVYAFENIWTWDQEKQTILTELDITYASRIAYTLQNNEISSLAA